MKTWTPDASEHFETWLGRVRLSIAGDPRVDVDDIAEDLRAHVHAELEPASEPVTVGALERVLDGLGNPQQWTDVERPSPAPKRDWFQRHVNDVLAEGQAQLGGDWGLPAVLLALTVMGIAAFERGTGVVLLAVAYFVARAQVIHKPETVVGRRRWIIYLPLAIGAGILTGLVLGFPLTFPGLRWNPYQTLWTLGLWWIVVGFVAAREPRRVRAVLVPFAHTFDASHGRMLALLGAAFVIASSVVMLR